MAIVSAAKKKRKRTAEVQARGLASKVGRDASGKILTSNAPGVITRRGGISKSTRTTFRQGRTTKEVTETRERKPSFTFRPIEQRLDPISGKPTGMQGFAPGSKEKTISSENVPQIPQFIPEGLRTTGDAQTGFGFEPDPDFELSEQRQQLLDEIDAFREGKTPGDETDGLFTNISNFLNQIDTLGGTVGIPEGTIDPSTGEPARVLGGSVSLSPAGGAGVLPGFAKGKPEPGLFHPITDRIRAATGAGTNAEVALSKGIISGLKKGGRWKTSLYHTDEVVKAGKFSANAKSMSTSKKILIGAGFTIFAADALTDIIGTYNFSGFLREEAIQASDFGFKLAKDNNDMQGMADSLAMRAELLDPEAWNNLKNNLPWANVEASLEGYWEASGGKWEIDNRYFQEQLLKGGG